MSVKAFYKNRCKVDGYQNQCKNCSRVSQEAHKLAHPEQVKVGQRRRRAAHIEQYRASTNAWYHRNRERRSETISFWQAKNAEKTRGYSKKYRLTHAEKVRLSGKAYYAAHSDKVIAKVKRQRARKANALINDFTAQQWKDMQAAYDYRCVYCHKRCKGKLTQDHLTPLSKGGNHTASNIIPACRQCNAKKCTGPVLVPVQPVLFL
jgi:5-methylcytosine-specific restriction endonuclease McrA